MPSCTRPHKGLALKRDLRMEDGTILRKGDRLEPSPTLPDVFEFRSKVPSPCHLCRCGKGSSQYKQRRAYVWGRRKQARAEGIARRHEQVGPLSIRAIYRLDVAL